MYFMKSIPNFLEYLHTTSDSADSIMNYGEYLHDLNQFSGFADQWGFMTFVLDGPSAMYPFVNNGTKDVLGFPKEAVTEGGAEFTTSRFVISDWAVREMMKYQLIFFGANKELDPGKILYKTGFTVADPRGKIRYVFQQYRSLLNPADALPLGYYGTANWIEGCGKESKMFQQIDVLDVNTQNWNTASYCEFYEEIDDDKLLSKREIEILRLIADGLNSIQIADRLYLSPHTVNTHRKNMLRKTNSSNTADLLAFAMRVKWI